MIGEWRHSIEQAAAGISGSADKAGARCLID